MTEKSRTILCKLNHWFRELEPYKSGIDLMGLAILVILASIMLLRCK